MSFTRLLPEFAPQSGVIITWPHPDSDWQDTLGVIEPVYQAITCAISRHEPMLVICYDDPHVRHVSNLLEQAAATTHDIHYVTVPTNDTWIRDYGPLSVAGPDDTRLLDFTFDGWGGKHESTRDNQVSRHLFGAGVFSISGLTQQSLVLEGGAIDTDGFGTLLTTTRCLLQTARNPCMDKAAVEACFHEVLGIDRVLWLDHGMLQGDDTDGHVDMLARFCTPHDIAYLQCTDADDAHYAELNAMERQLGDFISHDGTPYNLHPLPMPRAIHSQNGERLPASYANFLIINHAVLVPVYEDPADQQALGVLQRCFPDREMIAINCLPLIQQYGSLHCATMQLPEGVLQC